MRDFALPLSLILLAAAVAPASAANVGSAGAKCDSERVLAKSTVKGPETFINEQLAEGRGNFLMVPFGLSLLVCAW